MGTSGLPARAGSKGSFEFSQEPTFRLFNIFPCGNKPNSSHVSYSVQQSDAPPQKRSSKFTAHPKLRTKTKGIDTDRVLHMFTAHPNEVQIMTMFPHIDMYIAHR